MSRGIEEEVGGAIRDIRVIRVIRIIRVMRVVRIIRVMRVTRVSGGEAAAMEDGVAVLGEAGGEDGERGELVAGLVGVLEEEEVGPSRMEGRRRQMGA